MKAHHILFKIKMISLVLSVIILFNSCNRHNITPPINNTDNSGPIFGQVVKEDGTPLQGANVRIGVHSLITNANGIFYFSNIITPQNATLIEVNKANYFSGYRTLYITPNQDHYTRIMMMEKNSPYSLNAVAGGSVPVAGGGAIVFPPDALVYKSTGQPYTGIAIVHSKWIDPTGNSLNELIPGALRGIDISNTEKILQTFGMLAVEIFDGSNQPLQLAVDKTAELSFPIPASLLSKAPAIIPLWYFDPTTAMWKEEGSAAKQGSNYVGTVKHFSFWNCDFPGNFVNLELTLQDNTGSPIVNAEVKITNGATGAFSSGWTNSNGYVSGMVPDNATLNLEVIIKPCGISLYSQTFTTLSSSINLGEISITLPPLYHSRVIGTVLNCSSTPVCNDFVYINTGYNHVIVHTNSSGVFNANLLICNIPATATIEAYDMSNFVFGSDTTNLVAGINNLGVLSACENPVAYIQWTSTRDSVSQTFLLREPNDILYSVHSTPFASITSVHANANVIGHNPIIVFDIIGPDSTSGSHFLGYAILASGGYGDTTVGPVPVIITKYEAVNGFVEGSFSGNFISPLRTVSCNFRVRRQK